MRRDRDKIVTESWKKSGITVRKVLAKNSGKMREKRMGCFKNYPQIYKYEGKC